MPTYTAPGVYVEEVASTQKVLSAAPTAVAAFVGFTERCPDRRPERPARASPRGWSPAGPSSRACTAASPRARCCRCRSTATSPTAAALAYIVRVPEHRAVRRARPPGAAGRRPRARPAHRGREPSSRTPTSPSQVDHRRTPTTTTARARSRIDVLDGGEAVESFAGPHPRQGRRATSPRSSTRRRPRSRSRSC